MSSKAKQNKLKKLLRGSGLPNVYKQMILGNIAKLSDKQIEKAVKALEKERKEVNKAEQAIKSFEAARQKGWVDLAKKQQKIADKFVADTIKSLAKSAPVKKKKPAKKK